MPCFTPQEACGIDPKNIMNFGEEVVRGQPVFVLSILLQNLEPLLRKTAELASWQVGPFPLAYTPLHRTVHAGSSHDDLRKWSMIR